MVEIITRRARQHPASRDDINAACRLAQLAAIAGRHGAVAATCLRQSLLVYGWLRWRGLDPKLLLGIMPENGSFQAHAWVELEDAVSYTHLDVYKRQGCSSMAALWISISASTTVNAGRCGRSQTTKRIRATVFTTPLRSPLPLSLIHI